MPWKTYTAEQQRWGFVQKALRREMSLAELCRRSGISRKTAYKWLARFRASGRRGLQNQVRRAHRLHNRPSAKWLARLGRCKREHPHWGAPKIHWILKRRFGLRGVLSEAAISRWLKHWGLTQKRRGRVRPGPAVVRPKLRRAQAPNDVWTIDFKGWFRTGDGTKVEPLTVRDLASRYLLGIDLLAQQNMAETRLVMERLFKAYGLPRVIRADNGSPFGATGALGLTRLSAWWVKLGIEVEFIEPGHPEQNGAHEQMHRVYQAEVATPAAPSLVAQKRRTKQWSWDYNFKRPHEALGMRVPADHYRKSSRKLPPHLRPWRYPKGWESRLVKGNGLISWKGRSRFVGEAFERERVGLKRLAPGRWQVYYGPLLAGELSDGETGGLRAVIYRRKRSR